MFNLKKFRLFVPLLLAWLLTVPAAATEPQPVWVFDCEHFGTGKYRYMVAPSAIKIINTANGGIALAKAPTWRVSCFRESEKLEWTAPLSNFDESAISSYIDVPSKREPKRFTILGKETLLGLKCLKCKLSDNRVVWVAEEVHAAPQTTETVARYFNYPSSGGIPLRVIDPSTSPQKERLKPEELEKRRQREKFAKQVPWLSFKGIKVAAAGNLTVDLKSWKKIEYKAGDFEYPKGYKQTRDLKEVIISKEYRDVIKGLVDDLSR